MPSAGGRFTFFFGFDDRTVIAYVEVMTYWMLKWRGGVWVVAGLLAACGPASDSDDACTGVCGPDSAEGSSGTEDASGTEGSADSQPTGEAGSGGEPETGGSQPVTLESCMEQTGIALDCDADSRFQYVAFGDTLGCGGLASYTGDEVLRFAYSLTEMIGDDYPIREMRVYSPSNGGDHLVAAAPAAVLLWSLTPAVSDWVGEVHALPPGIFDVIDADAGLSMSPVPTAMDFELMNEVLVTGSFSLQGGAIVNIAAEVDDPTVQVVGCFVAPAQAHPIELD